MLLQHRPGSSSSVQLSLWRPCWFVVKGGGVWIVILGSPVMFARGSDLVIQRRGLDQTNTKWGGSITDLKSTPEYTSTLYHARHSHRETCRASL